MDLLESLRRHIGKTVTIFTTSGGLSGAGFTGVLAGVGNGCVMLITDIGAPPSCPVGSCCGTPENLAAYNFGNRCGSWLGSITEIPICHIASFVHNAINGY